MAHVKVILGALLACAICAQGFPAGDDNSPLGVNRPLLGAFQSTQSSERPAVAAITPGVTPSRPVRDAEPDSNESKESKESHELASSAASTTAKAPARRDATTNTPQGENRPSIPIRPLPGLQGIQTTQSSHTNVRREESPLRPAGTTNSPSSSVTGLRPGAKPGTTQGPSHSVNKREEASTTLRSGAKPAVPAGSSTTQSSVTQKNRRDATSTTIRSVALPGQIPQKPTRDDDSQDEVFKPLDLQNPQGQGFPSFQPAQPSRPEFSGVQTTFSLGQPQQFGSQTGFASVDSVNPQPGFQTFGGVSHGVVSRPDGSSSVSLSSSGSSTSRSRRQVQTSNTGGSFSNTFSTGRPLSSGPFNGAPSTRAPFSNTFSTTRPLSSGPFNGAPSTRAPFSNTFSTTRPLSSGPFNGSPSTGASSFNTYSTLRPFNVNQGNGNPTPVRPGFPQRPSISQSVTPTGTRSKLDNGSQDDEDVSV